MKLQSNSIQYFVQIRAALVMAERLGIVEAKPGLDYLYLDCLYKEIPPPAARLGGWQGYRWCYERA